MSEIGIGILGGGYMGKAHAVAMASVGAVFDTALRPRLEMVCASSPDCAERYRRALWIRPGDRRLAGPCERPTRRGRGDRHSAGIPSPAIAEAAFALGKPVFCEKPLGASMEDSAAMVAAAEASGVANMVGFNYIRTPASQYARAN